MFISTKGDYSLRMLAYLAGHQAEGPITLREVSARLDLSQKYMETIVKELVRSGLLAAVRGKGGGYRFRKLPDQITLWEVIQATENTTVLSDTVAGTSTPYWPITEIYAGLDQKIQEYLSGFTIYDLVQREEAGNDYVI